jgi:hypothetical protein
MIIYDEIDQGNISIESMQNEEEKQLWSIMEQSLLKLRQLQRSHQNATSSSDLQIRLLIRDTFRTACWRLACREAEEHGENPLLEMTRLVEQGLFRAGLFGRIKISIEPPADPDSPPNLRLVHAKRTNTNLE